MPKVITLSKTFLKGHPRAGQPTGFREAFENGTKKHTIRIGNRWKVGDIASIREWIGRPYHQPGQETIKDVEIVKLWDFEHRPYTVEQLESMTGPWSYKPYLIDGCRASAGDEYNIALNDGLDYLDFQNWFNKPFKGQIICWDNSVED